jgi:hypothetical protein
MNITDQDLDPDPHLFGSLDTDPHWGKKPGSGSALKPRQIHSTDSKYSVVLA